jgi:hypothetical protein
MKSLRIITTIAIVTALVAAAAVSTDIVSVLAKSSSTNFGQCQKAQIERFASHDFAHDFCKGVP